MRGWLCDGLSIWWTRNHQTNNDHQSRENFLIAFFAIGELVPRRQSAVELLRKAQAGTRFAPGGRLVGGKMYMDSPGSVQSTPVRHGKEPDEALFAKLCLVNQQKRLSEGTITRHDYDQLAKRVCAYFDTGDAVLPLLPAQKPQSRVVSASTPSFGRHPHGSDGRRSTETAHAAETRHRRAGTAAPRSRSQPSMSISMQAPDPQFRRQGSGTRSDWSGSGSGSSSTSSINSSISSASSASVSSSSSFNDRLRAALRKLGIKMDPGGNHFKNLDNRQLRRLQRIHSGKMKKRGRGIRNNWKPRGFQLGLQLSNSPGQATSGCLRYYSMGGNTKAQDSFKGSILITHRTKVSGVEDVDRYGVCLLVCGVFACETRDPADCHCCVHLIRRTASAVAPLASHATNTPTPDVPRFSTITSRGPSLVATTATASASARPRKSP